MDEYENDLDDTMRQYSEEPPVEREAAPEQDEVPFEIPRD